MSLPNNCVLNLDFIKVKIIYEDIFFIYFTYKNLFYNNFNCIYIFKPTF